MKNKIATINLINSDEKCFQYAKIVPLNHKNIKKEPQIIAKIILFIDQYNWKERNFTSHVIDRKMFETNKTIALNVLYVPHNSKEIRHAYFSKHNSALENQVNDYRP